MMRPSLFAAVAAAALLPAALPAQDRTVATRLIDEG